MIGLDWVRNFMFRGKSGFSRSGQHKFLGLVESKFLSFGSKSGQNLGSKSALFKVKKTQKFFL